MTRDSHARNVAKGHTMNCKIAQLRMLCVASATSKDTTKLCAGPINLARFSKVTEESESDANDWFLGAVGDNDPGESWTATLLVPIDFHIDTGAEVTLISQSAYKAIRSPPLFISRKNLKGPSGDNLPVDGWFHGTLATRCPQQCETKQEVYVIGQLSRCLLGQPEIRDLDLVR